MSIRWGIKGPSWRQVRELPSEDRARGWAKTLTGSNVSLPWIKIYRDAGQGWTLVETVPAEREHRRSAP